MDSDATAETIHTYDDLSRETMTCRGYEGANPTEPRYFAYDIFGRKLSEWDSVSEAYPALRPSFAYNLLDHLLVEARPIDGSTSFTKLYGRDEAGRMTSLSVQDAAAPGGAALVRDITYSHLGVPLRVVSRPGAPYPDITVSYAWDAGARMTTETDGAGGVWSYAYNPQGLPAHSADPLSNTTTIYYDLEGRATRSETADAGENLASFTEMTYAPTGEIVSRAFSDGSAGSATETYAYDECGRLTSVSSPGEVTLTYAGYDPANRPTLLTYEVGEKTYSETLSYTQGGAISSVLLPSGRVSYGYNEQGRLAHVESPGGTFYNYYYDDRGLPASLTLPGDAGETSYAYALDGRSAGVSLTAEGESAPSASVSLTYDAYGKVESMERDMEITDTASGTYAYAYDRLGRLTTAAGPAAIPAYAYTYDNRGPVAAKTVTPPGEEDPTTTAYAYDAAGRLGYDYDPQAPAVHLSAYAYDAAGRMTSAQGQRGLTSLAWDGLSRLIAATSAGGSETTQATYAYDHAGRMLARQETTATNTATSLFLPFALTQETAAVYDPAGEGNQGTLTYSFASGPSGIRLAQTDHTQDPAETTYPFRSPRGDVLALISEDGSLAQTYAYEPYGEMEEDYSPGGTPFLYQDDYRDPSTDLYQMQARWYDPQAALFTSPDPAMGDATDPTLRYPYAYCAGDPVYNSDPSGERLVEGNDPSTELHYTMASLQASARRRGIPVSRAAREKSAYLQKIIQKRALWKAMAAAREIQQIMSGEANLDKKGTQIRGLISSWDNAGPNEIVEAVTKWRDSDNAFLRYIYWDQKAREHSREYGNYLDHRSRRQFSNELAGVMAYIMLEAGPANMGILNDFIGSTGASDRVMQLVNRDFSNFEKATNTLRNWSYAHEKRLEALNEIESNGYTVNERMIVEDSPGGLSSQNRTAKSYWVGIDSSTPIGVVGAASMYGVKTNQDFSSTKYWHPDIWYCSRWHMLGYTQRPPVSHGYWDYREGSLIERPGY